MIRREAALSASQVILTKGRPMVRASPSTAAYYRDAVKGKQAAYAMAGVPEYWLAVPASRTVEVLVLVDGAYESIGIFQGDDHLPVGVLPALPVAVKEFFTADDL